jgi:hypothetical protein
MNHAAPALGFSPTTFILLVVGFLVFTFGVAHLLHKATELSRLTGWLWISFIILSLFVIVTPWLPISDYHYYVFGKARSQFIPWLFANVWVIMLFGLIGTVIHGVIRRVFWKTDRGDRIFVWILALGMMSVTGFGLFRAFKIIAEAPPEQRLRIAHESVVDVEEIKALRAFGGIELPSERTALMKVGSLDYILTPDNVVAVQDYSAYFDESRSRVFKNPVKDLTDMLVLPNMVLVVSGRTLGRSDGEGEFAKVADLPVEGLRFGQRIGINGQASEILLFGRAENAGVVYGLKPDGQYLKIAELDRPVTAATGCFESTVAAVGDKLYAFVPGREPMLLFKTPLASGDIVSVLADSGTEAGGCMYFVATADGVFALEGGVAHILIAGIGGELRSANESPFGAYLADARRHAAVHFSLASPTGK